MAWPTPLPGSCGFYEMANGLIWAERRNRLSRPQVLHALAMLGDLGISTDETSPALGTLVHLSRTYRLTAYDAAYLELYKCAVRAAP